MIYKFLWNLLILRCLGSKCKMVRVNGKSNEIIIIGIEEDHEDGLV